MTAGSPPKRCWHQIRQVLQASPVRWRTLRPRQLLVFLTRANAPETSYVFEPSEPLTKLGILCPSFLRENLTIDSATVKTY